MKVRGKQSSMRLGIIWRKVRPAEQSTQIILGQEVCGRRLVGSDLSPHWLNMVEDGRWYGEGRLIIKMVRCFTSQKNCLSTSCGKGF